MPYVISLHTNPDELRQRARSAGDLRARIALRGGVAIERAALSHADCVVCVYRFIEPYARRLAARRVEVIYNVVNGANLKELNRVLTDQISDLLFIHSPEARQHLLAEGRPVEAIHDVGNTMIDTLVDLRDAIIDREAPTAYDVEPPRLLPGHASSPGPRRRACAEARAGRPVRAGRGV